MDSKKGLDYRSEAGLKKMCQTKSLYFSMEDDTGYKSDSDSNELDMPKDTARKDGQEDSGGETMDEDFVGSTE
jgi:hypothetical protein